MVRAWVYNLKTENVLRYGREFGVDLSGTLDTTRKQLDEWVTLNEGRIPYSLRITKLAHLHGRQSPARESEPPVTLEEEKVK